MTKPTVQPHPRPAVQQPKDTPATIQAALNDIVNDYAAATGKNYAAALMDIATRHPAIVTKILRLEMD